MKSSPSWALSLIQHSASVWLSPGKDISLLQQGNLLGLQSLMYLTASHPEPAKAAGPYTLYLSRGRQSQIFVPCVYCAWLSAPLLCICGHNTRKLGSAFGQEHMAPRCHWKNLKTLQPQGVRACPLSRERLMDRKGKAGLCTTMGAGKGGLSVTIQPRNDAHDDGFPGH